jgi:hypothetical protein
MALPHLSRCQDPTNRGSSDPQVPRNLGFAYAGAVQFSDFRSVNGYRGRPTKAFSVLPGMCQARSGPFPQNLPFELREDGQQASHGSPSRRG